MPDAIITSTESTFGTISGTFANTGATITGTITGVVAGTLDGSVGVPGPGLPAGGTEGQIIVKNSDGIDYDTVWTDNAAETVTLRATNKTGVTLAKGVVVYINGAQGARPTIALAQADDGAKADGVIGILLASVANNGNGQVCTFGLARRLDTSAYPEGTKLFLSPSVAGGFVTSRPSAPDHAVAIGIVTHQHATQGTIEVNVAVGEHLEWLHDVLITTPTNGQVLKYDSTTSLWVNATDAVGAVTSVAGRTGAVTLSNTDISGLGTMATETATNYLTKAGNLSGLSNLTTSRNNLGLGATNTVAFRTVNLSEGAADIDDTLSTLSMVTSSEGFGIVASTASYVDDGGGSPIASNSGTLGVSKDGFNHGFYPTYDSNNPSSATTGHELNYVAATGSLSLRGFDTIGPSDYTTTLSPTGLILPASVGSITFGDATVQTTAFPGFEGYATESFVTSQGYITSSALTGYATESWVTTALGSYLTTASAAASYYPLSSNPAGYLTSAPVTSVAGRTGAVTLAVADVSGAAPTDSPTFTGTPTLPTGTIAVTQTAGDNTTAVATTAFVQQEVPAASTTAAGKVELATNAETITSNSTTLVPALDDLPAIITRPENRSINYINSTAVSGSGAASLNTYGIREIYLNSLATGRSAFWLGVPGFAQTACLMSRANNQLIDFSKKIWVSGKSCAGFNIATNYMGDSNTMCRVTLGGYNANGTGDMAAKGIGWKKVGGTSPYFTLTVHNGTTLTDVATTVQQSDKKVIDWVIYSDGSGNVTLYIDGAQAATTSAGPTGTSTAGYSLYREQVEATATPTVRALLHSAGGHIYTEG